jgi:hypothetical protein
MTDPTNTNTQRIKPGVNTPFHIDFPWWERESRELRIYLQSHLCAEHRAQFQSIEQTEMIDWVDPDTAEVQQVDGLQHVLRTHCAQQPGYLEEHTSLIDAIFRVFLANGNSPLTSAELAERIGRKGQGQTILKTLSGGRVYKGIRPVVD